MTQIQREIHWFLRNHSLKPQVFIAYERVAYTGKADPELRITFDWNIRWRTDRLRLEAGDRGEPVLDARKIIMEVKLPSAAPLWLAGLLSGCGIYPASFSKYGVCYQRHLMKRVNWDRETRAALAYGNHRRICSPVH